MAFQYLRLEVKHWHLQPNGNNKREAGTECKVQLLNDPGTHKPVGIRLTWHVIIETNLNSYADCLAAQTFINEQIASATEADVKEAIDFSQQQLTGAIKEKADKEGCTLLHMQPPMINEQAQLKNIVNLITKQPA